MAIINKTGIGEGNLIEAEHVTRAIDALSGVSSDTIVATGSFTGSFTGAFNGSIVSASYAATASYVTGTIDSASYAETASYVLQAESASFAVTASYVKNAQTASYIANSTLNQDLNLNGQLTISSSVVHPAAFYITTTNATTTDIYQFPKFVTGAALTLEASVIGKTGSAASGDFGTVGGNYVGTFLETDGIIGQTSSSFNSGFTTSGDPSFGMRYTGFSPGPYLRFFVKGLVDETIDWVVSVRITYNY